MPSTMVPWDSMVPWDGKSHGPPPGMPVLREVLPLRDVALLRPLDPVVRLMHVMHQLLEVWPQKRIASSYVTRARW